MTAATNAMMPTHGMRSSAPGQNGGDAQQAGAGRASSPVAVANGQVMPMTRLRPPAPGQSVLDAQGCRAGRPPSNCGRQRSPDVHENDATARARPRGE